MATNGGRRRWQSDNGHLESSLTGMALSTPCPRTLSRKAGGSARCADLGRATVGLGMLEQFAVRTHTLEELVSPFDLHPWWNIKK